MANRFRTKVFYFTTEDWGADLGTAAYAVCDITLLFDVNVQFFYLFNDGMMGPAWDMLSNRYLRYDWLHKRVEYVSISDDGNPMIEHSWRIGQDADGNWQALEDAARGGDSEGAFNALRCVTAGYMHIESLTAAARDRISGRIADEAPHSGHALDEMIRDHGLQAFPSD